MLTSAAEGTTSVPADVRLANLGRVVRELRSAGALSRAEGACRTADFGPVAKPRLRTAGVLAAPAAGLTAA